jgi:putative endonuclease
MLFGCRKGGSTAGTGRFGEGVARRHLEERGYEILDTNYRKRFGEVDIVARRSGTIVFVEVKTRHSSRFGTALEAVDGRKQRQLARIAQDYLVARQLESAAARFDVVAVTLDHNDQPVTIDHIENAFELSE